MVGSPSVEEASFIESAKARAYVLQMPHSDRIDFCKVAPGASTEVCASRPAKLQSLFMHIMPAALLTTHLSALCPDLELA